MNIVKLLYMGEEVDREIIERFYSSGLYASTRALIVESAVYTWCRTYFNQHPDPALLVKRAKDEGYISSEGMLARKRGNTYPLPLAFRGIAAMLLHDFAQEQGMMEKVVSSQLREWAAWQQVSGLECHL